MPYLNVVELMMLLNSEITKGIKVKPINEVANKMGISSTHLMPL